MNEYEITYLANPNLDEEAKNKLDEAIDAEISSVKGEISYSSPTDSPASRRRLHYPIGDKKTTWLRTMQVNLEQDTVEDLRTIITKTEGVNRVSIIQTPRRDDVSVAIFDTPETVKEATTAESKEPAKEVTDEDVNKGIEEALEEEVK